MFVEKVNFFSFNLLEGSESNVIMKVNEGFTTQFTIDNYIYDFINNVLNESDSFNYPCSKGRIELLVQKNKILFTSYYGKYIFENNDIVKNEFIKFLKNNSEL